MLALQLQRLEALAIATEEHQTIAAVVARESSARRGRVGARRQSGAIGLGAGQMADRSGAEKRERGDSASARACHDLFPSRSTAKTRQATRSSLSIDLRESGSASSLSESPRLSPRSAHRFLHERDDPCLFGGSQL